ncbi:MAG: LPS assembly protein LptD, partial [Gammaproteobacteria bacterium]|nr:LPS assembly protein LptD [Gammaproteobacteria bacterium]
TLLILLPVITAYAENPAAIPVEDRNVACWDDSAISPGAQANELAEDIIELTTDNADIQSGGIAVFEGPVEVRSRGRLLRAGEADYDGETGTFDTRGGVEFIEKDSRFAGDAARYNTRTGRLEIDGAEFQVNQTPARGAAENISVEREGRIRFYKVSYTSCPPGNSDWELTARSIKLDQESGMGTARKATLRFKGIPFLYVPRFTYPINDERKTGLLFPTLGTSDSRGFEYNQPYYWNIAPSYDMTIAPRYMSKRGLQLGTEGRLLTASNDAVLWLDFLPNDDRTDTDRWQYDLDISTTLPAGWRATTEATGISDDDYYEDLSARQSWTSKTHLARQMTFERYDDTWDMRARLQGYQTIDPLLLQQDEPYLQLPQFTATGIWRDSLFGMDYRLDAEANYFYRKDSVTGARLHMKPGAELPMQRGGLYIRPAVSLDITGYSLQDTAAGADDSPGRVAPIASIDAGAIFERSVGDDDNYTMTLEPRALYSYVPYRGQDDIPVFDTIRPDLNLIQLYRTNQFVGLDRLSDSNQISVGVTSRLLDYGDGRELLTATIGQTLFLEGSDVTLPGETPVDDNSSDYIAELGVSIWEKWSFDARYQYDTDTNSSARTSLRLRYRPMDNASFNVAYRYARDSLEQTDFSFSYPFGTEWNVIGRYNWSVPDSKVLDRVLGVEYSGCCWGVSLLSRRTIVRSTGEVDSSLALQFSLKGFSNFGSGTAQYLQRDILSGTRF